MKTTIFRIAVAVCVLAVLAACFGACGVSRDGTGTAFGGSHADSYPVYTVDSQTGNLTAPDGSVYVRTHGMDTNGWWIEGARSISNQILGKTDGDYTYLLYAYSGDKNNDFLFLTDNGDPALMETYVRKDYVFPAMDTRADILKFSRIGMSTITGSVPEVKKETDIDMFYEQLSAPPVDIYFSEISGNCQGSIAAYLDTSPRLSTSYDVYTWNQKYYLLVGTKDTPGGEEGQLVRCAEISTDLLQALVGHTVQTPTKDGEYYL